MVGTCEVASDDRLERDDLGLPDEHRAAGEHGLVLAHLRGHRVDVRGDEVRRDHVLELLEPKQRDLREHLALVRHALLRPDRARSMVAAESIPPA